VRCIAKAELSTFDDLDGLVVAQFGIQMCVGRGYSARTHRPKIDYVDQLGLLDRLRGASRNFSNDIGLLMMPPRFWATA
jgi:hypothetical protein